MKQDQTSIVIELVKCPYCDEAIPDTTYICRECTPLYEIDMATQSLMNAVDMLGKNKLKITTQRKKDINNIILKLNNIC